MAINISLTRGERFKSARLDCNQHGKQTMSVVQNATGVSASLIADLENDEKDRRVSYIDVATLAKHYGVTTDWLCGLAPDHHIKPCATSELGLSESSIYFLKSLNDVWSAYDIMTHPAKQSTPDAGYQAAKKWNEAIYHLKFLDTIPDRDSSLHAYASLCAEYGPALIDLLISAVRENYKAIVDYSDLQKAHVEGWDVKNEHLNYDDFIRFKASEIAKAIDRFLVSKFEHTSYLSYDRVIDDVVYCYKFND